MSPQHSIKARFAASLLGNGIRSAVSVLSGLVVARTLGPGDYGGFVFLLATLVVAQQLLDLGTSTAFFTFISRRPRGPLFFRVYAAWQFVRIGLLLGILAVLPDKVLHLLWLGHERSIVLLACAATILQQQLWTVAVQIGESKRMTRHVQLAGVAVAVAHLLLIWGLAHFGWMSQVALFWLIMAEYAVAIPLLFVMTGNPADPEVAETGWYAILKEYWHYCRPLAITAWVGVAYGFADNWLLQRFGGAVEQGFFAANNQLSAVSLLATTSLLQVFWKEMAECHHHGKLDEAKRLFDRSLRFLVLLSGFVWGALLPWSPEIVSAFLGSKYSSSWPVFALLLAFPIHTAIGQIVVAVYMATGRTHAQSIIFNAGMILSIPLAYLALSNSGQGHFGLGLGSLGLAGKLVIVQIIQVNVLWWWICRSLDWSYEWKNQVILPGLCLTTGLVVGLSARAQFIFEDSLQWIPILISFIAYSAVVGMMLWKWPSLIGVGDDDFRKILLKVKCI